MRFTIIVLLFTLVFLTGCQSTPATRTYNNHSQHKGDGMKVVHHAIAQIGRPYVWGGKSPRGFDCSGLVVYTHSRLGIHVPRTAEQQYHAAKRISPSSLKPGDLIFFRINHRRVSHVGIYVARNRFIHAGRSGNMVGLGSLKNPYWRKRFAGAGRLH
jgi:cell wall-associated NlpC family hydrolase